MAPTVPMWTTRWDQMTDLTVFFVLHPQKIQFQILNRKGRVISLFEILDVIGYHSDVTWTVPVQPIMSPGGKVYSFLNCSLSSVQLIHLRITVNKVFLFTDEIIVLSVKLTWKLNKMLIAKIWDWMKHISSFDDKRDIHSGMQSRNINNWFSKREANKVCLYFHFRLACYPTDLRASEVVHMCLKLKNCGRCVIFEIFKTYL